MRRTLNVGTIFGVILGARLIWSDAIAPSPKPALFLNIHAISLVFGGTLAVLFIAYPLGQILGLWEVFLMSVILRPNFKGRLICEQLLRFAQLYAGGAANTISAKPEKAHPLLEEGFSLLREDVIHGPQLQEVLSVRGDYFRKSFESDAKLLMSLGKFPPAFGLLAATAGMISMMSGLRSGGQDSIGPAMSVALVGTFWGIAVANLLILPLADFAQKLADDDDDIRAMIIDGLVMIQKREPLPILLKRLTGYLPKDQAKLLENALAAPTKTKNPPLPAGISKAG